MREKHQDGGQTELQQYRYSLRVGVASLRTPQSVCHLCTRSSDELYDRETGGSNRPQQHEDPDQTENDALNPLQVDL